MAGCSLKRRLPDAFITCPSSSLRRLKHTFIPSSVSNGKSSFKCVLVHHLVPAHALPIDSISSLKRLQHNSSSYFSGITSSATSSATMSWTQGLPSGPFRRTEKRPTLAAYQHNNKGQGYYHELSSVVVSMDVFSPFSRLRRSVKWLYYDCNRLTGLKTVGFHKIPGSYRQMKGRFLHERTDAQVAFQLRWAVGHCSV